METSLGAKRGAIRAVYLWLFLLAASAVFSQAKPDALVEYRTGNFERAVSICKSDISANPNNIEAHVLISWSLIKLGEYEHAKAYARKGRNLSRYDPRIIEILGEVSYYQGLNEEALQYFQEYVNFAPEGGRVDVVYYFMGEIYIRMGKFRHADIALSTAVRWLPGNADWWARLAYARESAGDLANAVPAYEKALALSPQHDDARRGRDRVRKALGKFY
jgi:tetratricopeptide (TPR) repeat protein